MAKARGLSGLKPPLALSPPPPAAGSTISSQRRIGDHEHEIPRQRLENRNACARPSRDRLSSWTRESRTTTSALRVWSACPVARTVCIRLAVSRAFRSPTTMPPVAAESPDMGKSRDVRFESLAEEAPALGETTERTLLRRLAERLESRTFDSMRRWPIEPWTNWTMSNCSCTVRGRCASLAMSRAVRAIASANSCSSRRASCRLCSDLDGVAPLHSPDLDRKTMPLKAGPEGNMVSIGRHQRHLGEAMAITRKRNSWWQALANWCWEGTRAEGWLLVENRDPILNSIAPHRRPESLWREADRTQGTHERYSRPECCGGRADPRRPAPEPRQRSLRRSIEAKNNWDRLPEKLLSCRI